MPAARITLAHLSAYSTMYLPNSPGDFPDAISPRSAIRCLSAGTARLALTALLSVSMIPLDVFRGTPTPANVVTSKPGTDSATVGTSGSNGARVEAVTASARNLPLRTYSIAEGKVGQTACTCPPSRSVSASDSPRSDRFEGSLADIFDLQDEVALGVVSAVTPKVEQAEIERAKRKPTQSLDAYEYFLRGMASFYQRSREAIDEALRLFYAAMERDGEFAPAYSMAAWCYVWRKLNGWTTDRAKETAETARLARRAAELGPDDAVALSQAAHALANTSVLGDLDDAVTFVDRALALNANLAGAWRASGWIRVIRGESETAVEHFARAMRLSPLDPQIIRVQAGTALAHLLAGRYDEASYWAEKAMWAQNYLTPRGVAVVSHALAGRVTEAKRALARLLELDPTARIANVKEWAPLHRREDLETLERGLRLAGLPEY